MSKMYVNLWELIVLENTKDKQYDNLLAALGETARFHWQEFTIVPDLEKKAWVLRFFSVHENCQDDFIEIIIPTDKNEGITIKT